MKTAEVTVVGGGLAGLSCAYALARSGTSVRLLEQADAFGEVGAGIQLGPNATRILRSWGLLDTVVEVGVLPRSLILLDGHTGDDLARLHLDGEFVRRYQAPYVVVHRSDLHRTLVDACREAGVTLETSKRVEEVDNSSEGTVVHCADGDAYASSVTLAADGLNSRLRRMVVEDAPIFSGMVVYRGTRPIDGEPPKDVRGWIGEGGDYVEYPLRGGRVLNQVATFVSRGYADQAAEWGGPDELDAAFGNFCGHVRDAIDNLTRDRHWLIFDREPMDRFVQGRVALVGDAAHPMRQYLAQGACQAFEDADALAGEVHRASTDGFTDWSTALSSFEVTRTGRAGDVQRTARQWSEMWHFGGAAAAVRNELFRTRQQFFSYMDWLYGVHRATAVRYDPYADATEARDTSGRR